ncbi:MAG: adenosylcobinamide-GDP ribazoletransferase [Christensenella sp.]|nr:adenosylcobinamide-GDP ribazoletransferase [Christensenella sp.]
MKRFGLAIQLMTRIPLRKQFDVSPEDYAGSVAWFPAIGLLVGAVMLVAYLVFSLTGIAFLPAFCSVIAAALVTGGFHIDGFADMCDAFFARKSRERTLAILKDSRMGTYGVLAIIFLIVTKTLLIAGMGTNFWKIWPVLLSAPVCGKIPMALCAKLSVYPREDGLGKYIIHYLKTATTVVCIAICAIIVLVCSGFAAGSIAFSASFAAGVGMYFLSASKIGGATGDVLGACNEVGEILYLFVMAVAL